MPLIQITMLKGRTAEQKRRIAARMTDVLVEEAGANRDAVVVTMVEVERDSYARGGVLIADRDVKNS
jgi:4-oxalocrotonate tautomerase